MSDVNIADVLGANVDSHPHPNQQAPEIVRDVMRLHGGDVDGVEPPSTVVASSAVAPALGTLDSKGTPYDPSVHVDTGSLVTARGTWRKRGRGAAVAPAAVELPPLSLGDDDATTPAQSAGTTPAAPALDHDAIAAAWVAQFFTFCRMILGADWQPDDDERREVEAAAAKYMRATNWSMDIPPGWALLLCVGMYAGKRAALPSTRERVALIVAHVTGRGGAIAQQQPEPVYSGANGNGRHRGPFGAAA